MPGEKPLPSCLVLANMVDRRPFPWHFRLFSPDAKHPAWRLLAAVPESDRSVRSFSFNFLQATAGTTLVRQIKQFPLLRVQGAQHPGGVWGETPA